MNMFLRALFLILVLIPAVSASSCPKNIHYLTPEYSFASGNMVFKYIDMDLSKDGAQDILTTQIGELVTLEARWAWGPSCPECTVYVNSFGSWDPDDEVMKLYSGSKGGASSIPGIPITFNAPNDPGLYTFRVIFAYDKEYAIDFDGSNLCSVNECAERGECDILIAEGSINVTATGLDGKIPLSVEITSPSTTEVSGVLEADVGSIIPIQAIIDKPSNTTVNVTVKIDNNEVSSLLPYSWNTFNSSTGTHTIAVTARDENGTFASDEIRVMLLNRSAKHGAIPPLAWSQRIRGPVSGVSISEKGSSILAGSGNGFVYLFDRTGKKIWEHSLTTPISSVAVSTDGKKAAYASGNVMYYVDRNGSILWDYSSSAQINSVAIDRSGDAVAFASGNVLHYLGDNGSLLWTYSTSNPIMDVAINSDGSRIASGSGNVLYYFNETGSMTWTHSSTTNIESVDITRDGTRIAFASGNLLYFMDNQASLLWNLSDVADAVLSSDGSFILGKSGNNLFAVNSGGSVIWRDISKSNLGAISVSPDGRLFVYSEGESIFLRDNSRMQYGASSMDLKLAAIILAAVIALAALIFLIRKKIPLPIPKIRIKRDKKEAEEGTTAAASLKVSAKVKVKAINLKTRRPVKGARVLIKDLAISTNEEGEAFLRDVPLGENVLTVEKDSYSPIQETFTVEDGENSREISLLPKVEVNAKNEEIIREIRRSLARERDRVSMHDNCLPNYYKSIGERIIEFLDMLGQSPELIETQEKGKFIDSFVEAGSMACGGLLDVITDWRNVKLYQAASELEKSECHAREVNMNTLHSALTSPEYLESETEKRLSELDSKMMERMNELTINPVSTLWKVSKELLNGAYKESEPKKFAMLFFANVIIDYANDMLENEEILKRLRLAIL